MGGDPRSMPLPPILNQFNHMSAVELISGGVERGWARPPVLCEARLGQSNACCNALAELTRELRVLPSVKQTMEVKR